MIIDNDFEIITPDRTGNLTFGGTAAMVVPSGTTAQRSGSPVGGMLRYNTDATPHLEAYVNGAWITLGGGGGSGTVTSVDLSGGTTGLTTSGGPITGAGTLTLAGTLAVANGGTGQTTATAAFDALAPTQTGNSGKYLTTNGTTVSWATIAGGGGSATNGTAILNFGTIPGSSSTSVVVTGQASILSTATVSAKLYYTGPTGVLFGDGVNWTNLATISTNGTMGLAYGAGVYVVSQTSTAPSLLFSSPDLITWTARTSTLSLLSRHLSYAFNAFFASDTSGGLVRSTDGITWSPVTSGFGSNPINGVAYGNGVWVAVGAAGNIATSPDGITWTIQTSPTTLNIVSVSYGNGIWVAVSNTILTSTNNGVTWIVNAKRFTPYTTSTVSIYNRIVLGGGKFVVTIDQQGWVSTDGLTWTPTTDRLGLPLTYPGDATIVPSLYGIAYGNGVWIAVGSRGLMSRSTDGINWGNSQYTPLTYASATSFIVGYVNGRFMIPAVSGQFTTSPDIVREHTAYEHNALPINITTSDIVPGTGFTINAVTPFRVTGTFTVKWSWSN